MQVNNISARPHHVGDVLIAPGETKEINDSYKGAINKNDLVAPNSKAAKEADASAETVTEGSDAA